MYNITFNDKNREKKVKTIRLKQEIKQLSSRHY